MTTNQGNEPIRIEPIRPEHVGQAADALARAYHGDSATDYLLDLSTTENRERFARVIYVGLEALRQQGETILVALKDEEPAGLALVSALEPQAQASLWAQLRWMLPHLPLLLTLLGQIAWRRLPAKLRLTRTPRHITQGYLAVMMLAVAPEHQGQGIGTRLMQAVADLARRDPQVEGIYLFTEGDRNRRFYERLGYRLLSRVEGEQGLVIYHMILPLDAWAA